MHGSPSNPSQHERLTLLFEEALALPEKERNAFATAACRQDADLRADLLSLLAAHHSADRYLEQLSNRIVQPVLSSVAANSRDAAPTPPAESFESLQKRFAANYRLESELRGAGMSRVFLALDPTLGRRVVIKLLPTNVLPTGDAGLSSPEIELAARLQHPYIVPLLTSGVLDGQIFYTMPYVAGESLRDLLARDGPLPVAAALRIWRDVLDAIAHAHASGVLHRDIKPGNILLSARHAFVTDFGIARAIESVSARSHTSTTGPAMGTPSYLAPEQIAASRVAGQAIDIYQSGLVMYEMLTGRLPHDPSPTAEALEARLTQEPLPLDRADVPAPIADLVLRCVALDPARRPASAELVLTECSTALVTVQTTLTGAATGAPRSRSWALAATIAAALIASIVYFFQSRPAARGALPLVANAPTAIAVLPLTTAPGDANAAAIADGMSQELVAILGQNKSLRVLASTSVENLNLRNLSVQQVAQALQVTHLLEGSIQRDGTRLRMRARLIDADTGMTRWSETYDRDFAAIFDIQEEVAAAISRGLTAQLNPVDGVRPRQRRTASAAAYEWYLRGKDVALMRNRQSRLLSIEYFKKAIAADPAFSSAHAGLAIAYAVGANNDTSQQRQDRRRLAEASARQAIALDASDPEAYVALGWLNVYTTRNSDAETDFERALALDPQVARGHEGLARAYMFSGKYIEQLRAAEQGLRLDPLSHSAIREWALALATNGRCGESLEPLQDLKSLSPPAQVAGMIRGLCFLSWQDWTKAIEEFRWADTHGAGAAPAFLGFALARAGQNAAARNLLADLKSGRENSHGAMGVAIIHAGLREYDQAFAWLNRSVDEESITTYLMHPALADLRRDPRFADLRRRLGLKTPLVD